MTAIVVSKHAQLRLSQRGMSLADAHLIIEFGSEAADGYLITRRDVAELQRETKWLLHRVARLESKLIVVRDGALITAFHSTKSQQRRFLSNAA